MSGLRLTKTNTPATPAADKAEVFVDLSDGLVKYIDETGTVRSLSVQRNQNTLWYRQAGTSPLELWYPMTLPTGGDSVGTSIVSGNLMVMIPFPTGRGGVLDRIAIRVTSAATAGGRAQLGLYLPTSESNIYPGALLADYGEVVTDSTGIKSVTIDESLPADSLIWGCAWFGAYATNPTMRTAPIRSHSAFLMGTDNTLDVPSWISLSKSHTYAVGLPDPAPSGLTPLVYNTPQIFVRYSA